RTTGPIGAAVPNRNSNETKPRHQQRKSPFSQANGRHNQKSLKRIDLVIEDAAILSDVPELGKSMEARQRAWNANPRQIARLWPGGGSGIDVPAESVGANLRNWDGNSQVSLDDFGIPSYGFSGQQSRFARCERDNTVQATHVTVAGRKEP